MGVDASGSSSTLGLEQNEQDVENNMSLMPGQDASGEQQPAAGDVKTETSTNANVDPVGGNESSTDGTTATTNASEDTVAPVGAAQPNEPMHPQQNAFRITSKYMSRYERARILGA